MPKPPKHPNIRGILFDKDGTLFDFQATWGKWIEATLDILAPDRDTWARMARAGGYDPRRRRFVPGSPVVAGAPSEIAKIWAEFRPDMGVAKVEGILDEIALDTLTDPKMQFPTAVDLPGLMAGLRASSYALGIATHDSEQGARIQLGGAGADTTFDFIAGYDSGHGLKPGPGMLLAFARATGMAPENVVMVGDSLHDLQVAHNAGAAMAVGVLTGPATRADLKPFADHILPSIEDLPQLLAQFSGNRQTS